MEGKIEMAARRQVTNKLRDGYRNATKRDKARVLDEVMATTGMGRLTARRMLNGPVLPSPVEQIDGRTLRPKAYSDDCRLLLEHVWALMGCPCEKYLVVMLELWLPMLQASGDFDKCFATPQAIGEVEAMSAATVDRYLAPARRSMRLRGISRTIFERPNTCGAGTGVTHNADHIKVAGEETATQAGVTVILRAFAQDMHLVDGHVLSVFARHESGVTPNECLRLG